MCIGKTLGVTRPLWGCISIQNKALPKEPKPRAILLLPGEGVVALADGWVVGEGVFRSMRTATSFYEKLVTMKLIAA